MWVRISPAVALYNLLEWYFNWKNSDIKSGVQVQVLAHSKCITAVAQLEERQLTKLEVVGSNLTCRSNFYGSDPLTGKTIDCQSLLQVQVLARSHLITTVVSIGSTLGQPP